MTNVAHSRRLPKREVNVVALLVALLALWLVPQQARAQDALWKSFYERAQNEYQHGDFVVAKSMLLMAYNHSTKADESLTALYYLAHTCVKCKDYPEAEKYYSTLIDELGTKTWAVLRPPDGTPDWEQDATDVDSTAAADQFLKALNKRPAMLLKMRLAKPVTIVDVLIDYGSLLQTEERLSSAETAYKQALSLADCRPDQAVNYNIRVMQKLAVVFDLEGKPTEAAAVNQQLYVTRNSAIPNFDQIVSHAIDKLSKIRRNSKQLAIRFNNLALFCARHGDYAKAEALFERALSCVGNESILNKKERAAIMTNYADLLLAMGKTSEANSVSKQINEKNAPKSVSTGSSF